MIYSSGHETIQKNPVAKLMKNDIKYVLSYNPISYRLIFVRITGHPVNVDVLQVNAYTQIQWWKTMSNSIVNCKYATPRKDTVVPIIGMYKLEKWGNWI